ncbi:uncharacterized protein LOC121235162 [Juglans microcarpa x Juglans regia]|uniref:uncharacterized protein LOC121235162 n=1 Tax=Juglans microcarpa x Juglans regia TaxID=2249226 RepID=UPI001B7E6E0D|nr:uncharacterized protein LOC121235162 [Juglans microcarpa x Juglans regia]
MLIGTMIFDDGYVVLEARKTTTDAIDETQSSISREMPSYDAYDIDGEEINVNSSDHHFVDDDDENLAGVGSCKFCRKKHKGESIKWDGVSQHEKPMISPNTSLYSSDSFVSNCSEYLVDVNSDGQESCRRMESNSKESNNGNYRHIARDVEIQTTNGQEAKDGVSGNHGQSSDEVTEKFQSIDIELDAKIWEPSEVEDLEDDMKGNMAYNDEGKFEIHVVFYTLLVLVGGGEWKIRRGLQESVDMTLAPYLLDVLPLKVFFCSF